jgi:hypothetical protein
MTPRRSASLDGEPLAGFLLFQAGFWYDRQFRAVHAKTRSTKRAA